MLLQYLTLLVGCGLYKYCIIALTVPKNPLSSNSLTYENLTSLAKSKVVDMSLRLSYLCVYKVRVTCNGMIVRVTCNGMIVRVTCNGMIVRRLHVVCLEA